MAGPIRVDIEGLDQLGHSLRDIRHRLENLSRDFRDFENAIGAIGVRRRLAEVAGNWSNARQRINRDLSRLADMAGSAAQTYRATEQEVSRAANSPRQDG